MCQNASGWSCAVDQSTPICVSNWHIYSINVCVYVHRSEPVDWWVYTKNKTVPPSQDGCRLNCINLQYIFIYNQQINCLCTQEQMQKYREGWAICVSTHRYPGYPMKCWLQWNNTMCFWSWVFMGTGIGIGLPYMGNTIPFSMLLQVCATCNFHSLYAKNSRKLH